MTENNYFLCDNLTDSQTYDLLQGALTQFLTQNKNYEISLKRSFALYLLALSANKPIRIEYNGFIFSLVSDFNAVHTVYFATPLAMKSLEFSRSMVLERYASIKPLTLQTSLF